MGKYPEFLSRDFVFSSTDEFFCDKDARTEARRRARFSNCDYGLKRNDLFRYYYIFRLPGPKFRFGFEALCEVVHPEPFSTEEVARAKDMIENGYRYRSDKMRKQDGN